MHDLLMHARTLRTCCMKVGQSMTAMRTLLLALLVVVATPTWSAGAVAERLLPARDLHVDKGFVRGLPPGSPVTAAYFVLNNPSATAFKLIGARSPNAARVEIHSHEMQNGMARMRKRDSVSIPAHSRVQFAPGGLHLMLFQPTGVDAARARIPITLVFAGGSRIEVSFPVCSVRKDTCP